MVTTLVVKLAAPFAVALAFACAPEEPSEIVVKRVEVRDFKLATSTLLADGNFGQAVLAVTDPEGVEHEIPVDVRGGSPWNAGHEVVLGIDDIAAAIDIADAQGPITADRLFGPYYGVRADHALGAALELGWYTDLNGIDLMFAVWGAGAGLYYAFDIIRFEPAGERSHELRVFDRDVASPW